MSSDKKAAKKLKRDQKKKDRKIHYETKMPLVRFGKCSESKFAFAIKLEFQKFSRDPKDYLPPYVVRMLRTLRDLKSDDKFCKNMGTKQWKKNVVESLLCLADAVFNKLPLHIKKYCPEHCYGVTLNSKNEIFITFSRIIKISTKNGIIHFSSKMPKIIVNRIPAKLVFASHAFDRIIERCLPKQDTYNGVGMVHSLFGGNLFFEIHNNEMLKVYFLSRPEDIGLSKYDKNVYTLVGYCPLDFIPSDRENSSSWVAKTLLTLGMTGTPQKALLKKLSQDLQGKFYKKVETIIADRNIYALLWFHYNGYPCFYEKKGKGIKEMPIDWGNFPELKNLKTPEENLEYFLKLDEMALQNI